MKTRVDFYEECYFALLNSFSNLKYEIVSITDYNDNEYLSSQDENYEIIILLNNSNVFETKAFKKVMNHLETGKKVISCYNFSKESCDLLKKQWGSSISFMSEHYEKNDDIITHPCIEKNIPIIFLCGIGEKCDSFSNQVNLVKALNSLGVRSLNFSDNDLAELFGIHNVKKSLQECCFKYNNTIELLRQGINNEIENHNPEIVTIQLEAGLFSLNSICTNGYGEIWKIISQAYRPDIIMMGIYSNEYSKQDFEHISQMCKKHLGQEVACYLMTRNAINYHLTFVEKKPIYYTCSMDRYEEYYKYAVAENECVIKNNDYSSIFKTVKSFFEEI